MNKQRLLDLAKIFDILAQPDSKPKIGFYMGTFVKRIPYSCDLDNSCHGCGTVACVAGWAVAAFGTEHDKQYILKGRCPGNVDGKAAGLLGLSNEISQSLFFDFTIQTPADAARELRKLAAE